MTRVFKRDKIWYIDYSLDGKRRRKAIGPYKEMAEFALKDIEVRIAKKRAGLPVYKKLTEWHEEFNDYIKAHLKPRSAERYREVIDSFVSFLAGAYPKVAYLQDITPDKIDRYKLIRLEKIVKTTVNHELTILRRFFNLAIDRDYIPNNPANKVDFLRITDRRRPRFLSGEQIKQLQGELRASRFKPMVDMLLYTGMRVGELINLEWEDIDLGQGQINIRPKLGWSPKAGKERSIPLSGRVRDLLSNMDRKHAHIFHSKTGNMVNRNHLREAFVRACRRANIENTTLHTLRHTFASQLVMKGIDLYTVSQLLGHSDLKSTQIYSHLSQDHLKSAVERLEF
jgi:integrase